MPRDLLVDFYGNMALRYSWAELIVDGMSLFGYGCQCKDCRYMGHMLLTQRKRDLYKGVRVGMSQGLVSEGGALSAIGL